MTSEYREMKPTDLIRCVRCGKAEFVGNAKGWNVDFNQGVATCFICPDCQTQEEFIEAEVNEAMTDYSKTKVIHNLEELLEGFRPLWREALTTITSGEVERGNRMFADYLERFRVAWNAMHRYDMDAQIEDVGVAMAVLQELGEIGEA